MWILSHYVSTYPLSHWVTTYSCIDFDIHLRQHIKLIVRLFVILKATEGRKVHKRHNYVSMYLALSGILLQSGRVFCSCSHIWKNHVLLSFWCNNSNPCSCNRKVVILVSVETNHGWYAEVCSNSNACRLN